MPVTLNLSFDLSGEKAKAEKAMNAAINDAISYQINSFFRGDRHNLSGSGSGYKEIDELITKRFLSDDFQRKVHKYFDDNWEEMFKKAMEEALRHQANKTAFQRAEALHKSQLKG